MGDSACLMQSFSHTSDNSHEAKEGNPIRALGESVSFGRFLSESLSWEKWSSFSHNRHLEEVEKYSKPGSVAQKKAYFEAHYKKIAAKKAAEEAALREQENGDMSNVCEPECKETVDENTSMDSEMAGSNTNVAINELQETGFFNTGIDFNVDANGSNSNVEMNALEAIVMEEEAPLVEDQILEESPVQFESKNPLRDSGNQNKVIEMGQSGTNKMEPSIKVSQENSSSKKELASKTEIKPVVSSSKPTVSSRVSKLPFSPAKYTTPVHGKREDSASSNSKKSAINLLDKKKMAPKSLHMSLNLAPSRETNKAFSPIIQKVENSRVTGSSSKTSDDSKTPRKTPFRASVNGLQKGPSATPQSENRRSRAELAQILPGSRKVDAKWQSLSVDRSKSASDLGNKSQSLIMSSPFNFRTEARSSKRKEKLEDKFNAKEAQKMQLQSKSKEKAENELKKLRQSLGFKARPMPDFYRETESSKNPVKKIPPTRPRSPKLGRKTSTNEVHAKSPLPPRNPSVNSDGSKRVMEKKNRTSIRFLNSLPKDNTHENASPNIQG